MTSPVLMPIRKRMRRSSAAEAPAAATPDCISIAARTASTALSKVPIKPSPVHLTTPPVIALGRRCNQRGLEVFHTIKGVGLVFRHQPAVADDVGHEHRKQAALFGGMAHIVLGSEEGVE